MKSYRGYLIDLDGTIYHGNKPIPEAIEFIRQLREKSIPYLFLTNNSSATPQEVSDRLCAMGISTESKDVVTSSDATAEYIIQQDEEASVYLIGENGIRSALESRGIRIVEDNPRFVVMGIDRSVTYEKFAKATLAIHQGATFISTNADKAIPTERGLLPGNGSLTSVVSSATGVSPVFIGKPGPILIEYALKQLNLKKHEVLVVGDNYDTDIQAGIQNNMDSLLVLTGYTKREHLNNVSPPTYIVESLKDWSID